MLFLSGLQFAFLSPPIPRHLPANLLPRQRSADVFSQTSFAFLETASLPTYNQTPIKLPQVNPKLLPSTHENSVTPWTLNPKHKPWNPKLQARNPETLISCKSFKQRQKTTPLRPTNKNSKALPSFKISHLIWNSLLNLQKLPSP